MAIGLSAPAQISVSARIEPEQATLEDELTLTVSIKGSMKGSEPVLPNMPAFKVIASGTSSSLQIINGDVESRKEYSYVLIPQEEGTFTIDPITLFLDGREYKSEPVTVTIGKALSQSPSARPTGPLLPPSGFPLDQNEPQAPSPPFVERKGKDYWITASVSKKNPYINEQILYTFRFYTRVRVREATLTIPEFKDFWSEEVVPEKKYYREIEGDRFVVSEKVIALYPLKTGEVTIPETVLKIEVPEGMDNPFFNDPFFGFGSLKTRPKNLKSDSLVLTILPLPDPPPQNFANLVGQFQMKSALSSRQVKEGETTTLTVEISGRGNIKDAVLPPVSLDGFKVYDDKPVTETVRSEEGILGKKIFKKALVPLTSGELVLPPLSLDYFNPMTGKFESLQTEPVTVSVAPSDGEQLNDAFSQVPQNRDWHLPVHEEIATIHTHPSVLMVREPIISSRLVLVFLFGIPPLVYLANLLVGLIRLRRLQNPQAYRKKRAFRIFLKNMSREGVHDLEQIRDYFGAKWGLRGSGLTTAEVIDRLEASGMDRNLLNDLRSHLHALERSSYGGEISTPSLRSKTVELIQKMERKKV